MTTDNFVFIYKTDLSKPVQQEVNSTVILPPLVFREVTDKQSIAYYGTEKITALKLI